MKFNNLDTQESPYFLLTRASLSATAMLRKALASAGLGNIRPAYLGVLMCLWKEESLDEALAKLGTREGMKIAELGRCAGLEPSSMTGVIDRMERDGLVERTSDPDDRRAQIIRLTAEGSRVRGKVTGAVDAALAECFAGIDMKRLAAFSEVLRAVLRSTNRGELS